MLVGIQYVVSSYSHLLQAQVELVLACVTLFGTLLYTYVMDLLACIL